MIHFYTNRNEKSLRKIGINFASFPSLRFTQHEVFRVEENEMDFNSALIFSPGDEARVNFSKY